MVNLAPPSSQAAFAPWAAPWPATWRSVMLLVLGVAALRIVYLAWLCPYTLLEDEAHYWEWSRHLDWSYYSKPPGIAAIIAASTAIFGTSEFAVRFPAVLSSVIAALSLAALARDATGDRRAGFFAAALFQLVPLFQSTSLLMTIDMPYAACWSLAAWLSWRAFARGGWGTVVGAGLAIAAGLTFKHTMLLLIPGLLVFAWIVRRDPGLRRASDPASGKVVDSTIARFGVITLISLLGLLPNVIWNAQRDWPTARHLLGHLGLAGGDVKPTQSASSYHYDPMWTLEFLGTQLALAGPMLVLAVIGWRALGHHRAARSFLLCSGAPIVLFYLGVSVVTEPEGNWAFAGYTTLTVLAAWGVVSGMDDFAARVAAWRALPEPRPKAGLLRRRPETLAQVSWHAALAFGLIAGFGILRLDLLAKLPGVGPKVPLSRLMGADQMAAHVARLEEELRVAAPGREPFVISQFYGRASQLSFYLPGRPVVYCSGSRMGGRKSQYDLWPHTDLANPALAGRPAVLLGDADQDWSWGFRSVTPRGKLEGDRKRNREAFTALEYTPPAPPTTHTTR